MQIQIVYSIYVQGSHERKYWRFPFECKSIGNEARKCLIQKCVENPNRFEEMIKKIKSTILQQSQGNGATLIRDLFGLMLCLSMQQKIYMAEVLKYLVIPVVLCLSHVDGSG